MYGLSEIRRFAPDWLRSRLDVLAGGSEAERRGALSFLADTCWRWTARAVRELLPDESPLVTEYLLHTLCALDPRIGVEAGLDLCGQGAEPHATVARIFLAGLPPRLVEGLDLDAPWGDCLPGSSTPEQLVARLSGPCPITRAAVAGALAAHPQRRFLSPLFARGKDDSPGVVRCSLESIGAIAPDKAVTLAKQVFTQTESSPCRQAAAEFLVRLGHDGVQTLLGMSDKREFAVARALARWCPDQAMAIFRTWARSTNHKLRTAAVNIFYELAAMELRWPSADAAGRIGRCRDLSIGLLRDPDQYVRATAIVVLAEVGWPAWQDRAVNMLLDGSYIVRFEVLGLLDEKDAAVDPAALVVLLEHPQRCVRERTFTFLRRILPDPRALLARLRKMCASASLEIRKHAVGLVARWNRPEGSDLLRRMASDRDEEVRGEALEAGLSIASDREAWLELVRRRLRDRHWKVRQKAVALLGEHGGPGDLAQVTARLRDRDEDVRQAALDAAVTLAPDRTTEFARTLLTDPNRDVATSALGLLREGMSADDLLAVALEALPRARGDSGPLLLELIRQNAPDRWDEAVELALRSRSEEARARAAEVIAERAGASDVARLKRLLEDRGDDVRLAAIKSLRELAGHEVKPLALARLRDGDWRVRMEALSVLADDPDPLLVDSLLPLARDDDEDVRREAIRALAKFDDARVFSELLSSVNDVDAEVRQLALAILNGQHGPVPSVARLAGGHGEAFWQRVLARVDAINRWASRIGRELLGRPVTVRNYRQGLGRTMSVRRGEPVEIEVNDTPVTSGHPHGEDIMRGLALHEIGHHLCDVGVRGDRTMRGIARSEGVDEIYDILRDERLERVLRSRRPEWGTFFDRIASYAFAQNTYRIPPAEYARLVDRTPEETRELIARGKLPGEYQPGCEGGPAEAVVLRDRDMLAMPGMIPPLGAFLVCLRCGFDPKIHPDPKVARAVALVPANLKDMSHKEVLAVARQIGELLGKSSQFKDDMKRMQRRIGLHREALRGLAKALERMAETGQLPGWMRQEAPGIRTGRIEVDLGKALKPTRLKGTRTQQLNLGRSLQFNDLDREEVLAFDPAAHENLVALIRRHIRRLRSYLERLGTRTVEQYAARRGRRLDLARIRPAVLTGSPNLLVHEWEETAASAYIGLLIDRSGSMEGTKLELAKRFGALVAESAKGLQGIEGHVNGFDDDTFFRMGDFRRTAIAALTSGGGNNDSAGLQRAAELALGSRKRNKLVLMISDGSPTECTFESLKKLVAKLTRDYEIVCAQVAVQSMEHVAFPHYVDLSRYPMDEAVARFGKMLMQLTASWR